MPPLRCTPQRWALLLAAGWLTAACGAGTGSDALAGGSAATPPVAPLALLSPSPTGSPAGPLAASAASPAPGAVRAARPPVAAPGPYRRADREPFRWRVLTVTPARLGSSYRPGCPVPVADLRLLQLTHLGFDGRSHVGELVVHRTRATAVVEVFRRLHAARFPVERMVTVEQYGSDDDRSMAANNTSGYNCRLTTGGTRWSEHAYGTAVDVNPVQNPYVRGSTVEPEAGRAYLDRSRVRPGMIVAGDPVVRAFAAAGWAWGGDFSTLKDYQHFSASGR